MHDTVSAYQLIPAPTEIALLIPTAQKDLGAQRKSVFVTLTFPEVLKTIYDVIGCGDVRVKPVLSYKLSTATQKALPISLTSAEDWDGLLESVEADRLRKTKAAQATSVSITINVSEQVSNICWSPLHR